MDIMQPSCWQNVHRLVKAKAERKAKALLVVKNIPLNL